MTEVVDENDKNTNEEEEGNKDSRNDELINKHNNTNDKDLETGIREDESLDSDIDKKSITPRVKEVEEETDNSERRLFPDLFYCPITGDIFKDPVVISDGRTYERAAIMKRHQEEKEKEQEEGNAETTSVTTTITTTTITKNENGTTTTTTTRVVKGDNTDDSTKTVGSNEESNNDGETDNDEEKKKEKKSEVLYYPNRALLSIIQESVKYQQSFFKRVESNTRTITGTILDRIITSATPSSTASSLQESQLVTTFRPLPDGYYCPITFGILHDPVIDPEGNTFEHAAVYNWIRVHGTSPVTRSQASIEDLYPNHAIRELLEQEKKLTGKGDEDGYDESLIHPSIRKWKTEEAPKISDADFGGDLQPSDDDEENYRRISCCYWLFIMFVLCVFIPVFCCVSCCCPGYFNIIEEEEEEENDGIPLFEIEEEEEEDLESQELDRENREEREDHIIQQEV